MVTRQERIDDFIHEGSPPNDQPLQILCEDHVGTYYGFFWMTQSPPAAFSPLHILVAFFADAKGPTRAR